MNTRVLAPIFLPWLVGCGPSPDSVCEHVIELARRELGDEAAAAIERTDCVESARRERETKGVLEYRKQAECIVRAGSLDELSACE
jgi:hypothetical protein